MARAVINHLYSKPPRGGFVYEPPETFPGDYVPHENYKQALRDMVDRKMLKSKKYQEQQWRALRMGAHPEVLLHMRLMVARFASVGVPMYPYAIVRTAEEQWKEYREGDSKAKPDKAPHVWGGAYDLIHSVHGWNLSKKQWEFVGHVGKELAKQRTLDMTWGGDWPPIVDKVGWDPAHWQLRRWRQVMSEFPWPPQNKGIAHK